MSVVGGNLEYAECLMGVDDVSRCGEVGGVVEYPDALSGVDHACELPAFGGAAVVDNHDGDVVECLGVVYECVYDGVHDGEEEEEQHDADVGEYHAEFSSPHFEQGGEPG